MLTNRTRSPLHFSITANDLIIREEDLMRCAQRYSQSLNVPSVSAMLIDESVD